MFDRPIIGQTSKGQQRSMFERNNVNVLVATCGRLMDHMKDGRVSLERVKFFVVDEADRMLSENSMDDLEDIIKSVSMPPREKRQTLMYSATFPEAIQRLARNILNPTYLFCSVGVVGAGR